MTKLGTANIFPAVSVIIVNYNGLSVLKECLESLSRLSYPNYQVIIVDNNSNDGSVNYVRTNYPDHVVIIREHNEGFARANNIGAHNSNAKYLFFLNNDTIVTENSLEQLVRAMELDPEAEISQSLLLRMNGSIDSCGDFGTIRGLTYNSKKDLATDHRLILSARGAAMMVKRDFFLSLGGFDEDYFISFEDVEFGWRAWILGYKVIMVPSSVVYHMASYTTSQMDELITFHGLKNQLSLISTHFELPRASLNVVFMFWSLLSRFLTLTLSKNKGGMFNVNRKAAIRAVIWYFGNLRRIHKKQKELNRKRKRSTSELMRMNLLTKYTHDQ